MADCQTSGDSKGGVVSSDDHQRLTNGNRLPKPIEMAREARRFQNHAGSLPTVSRAQGRQPTTGLGTRGTHRDWREAPPSQRHEAAGPTASRRTTRTSAARAPPEKGARDSGEPEIHRDGAEGPLLRYGRRR